MNKIFIIICILLFLFIIFVKNKETYKNKNKNINSIIKTLIRQCSRWAVAAKQDESPIIALLHSNYAAGYLWALKDIATDIQIKKATNIDIIDYTKKILEVQDISTKKVSRNCPQFMENIDLELAKLGGNF